MMTYSERRARERASAIRAKPNAMDSAGSAAGGLQRELAQTIALILELHRQYEFGAVRGEREREIWAWAGESAITFERIVGDLRAVNTSLSRLVTPVSVL